ncbi:adenine-specific DNA-methyltransferase [Paenibacillus endophyticus]|uniref:Adenine-specific DNA-methyltransferase n=1 Tax=Paenibacillus endophyticus TaxID=1294268 RepID=A0A7W5GA78_9BACL|nr:site-specific DNA-methyltransferase [Paenibacillus endophyticus]MBB3152471.1 adenine-specific DNA-methyltransferase [Paenibacillus endophyticus]
MQKLDGKTMDLVAENVRKMRELFPEVFTEDKIDIDKFLLVMGDNIEKSQERYEFNWNGKTQAMKLAQKSSTGTLRPCKEESKNWDTTENLYIEGDNLEVLRLLQKAYHKKVKMIYIDPPYNTGNDFVYKDDFRDNISRYKEQTGQMMKSNAETSGRYHTDWLNMMYPRLRLAKSLLQEDGIIFVSIDDHEFNSLKRIMDEIYGEENRIETIVWKKSYGGGAKEKYLVTVHEYILMYAKDITMIDPLWLSPDAEAEQKYYHFKDEYFETLGPFRVKPMEATKSMDKRENLIYPIPAPDGTEIWPKRQWWWSKDRAYKTLKEGKLYFAKNADDEWSVQYKQYLKTEDGEERGAKAFSIIEGIYTQAGSKDLTELFGENRPFQFPKPVALIQKLLDLCTSSNNSDIILDFFSGSGSTAHAVLEQNYRDAGNRKFIMVQLDEQTIDNSIFNNICEIGKERIRLAGNKIVADTGIADLDTGFKVFKLDSSNLKVWNSESSNISHDLIELMNPIKDDRTQDDVLYEIMLKYGIGLTMSIEVIDVSGNRVASVGMGYMLVCLDDNLTLDVIEGIAKMKPKRAVFSDAGFQDDNVKTNAVQLLRKYGVEDFRAI